MINKIIITFLTVLLILSGCDSSTSSDETDNFNIDKTKPVTLFCYFYENNGPQSQIQIVNSDKAYNVFSDGVMRSYPSLSFDKSKIVYLHNFAFIPMYGFYGDPSVRYYDLGSKVDIEILPSNDAIVYYNPVWVTENKIAVEKIIGDLISLQIINLEGSIISEKVIETNYAFDKYVSPDKNYIVLVIDSLMIYDIYSTSVNKLDSDIKYSSKPIFHNGGFYFNAESGAKFYNFSTGILEDYNITGDLCFINDDIKISKINDYFKLMDINSNPIDSVFIDENTRYYGYLQAYKDSSLYFYGENRLVDDENAVFKVDFNDLSITNITNLGNNNFIMSVNSFE